jgi:RNA polymerase sigma factor (TIGR02999 family)
MDQQPVSETPITAWLLDWRNGDPEALRLLTSAVYQELRRMAAGSFAKESGDLTIQPTALVHELYLRLPGVQSVDWKSRGQFLAVASRIMRNILVDEARRRRSLKRGGNVRFAQDGTLAAPAANLDLLVVNDALDRFEAEFPRQARVLELRFFGGLTAPETAEALELSLRTVERDWTFARAWLHDAITRT